MFWKCFIGRHDWTQVQVGGMELFVYCSRCGRGKKHCLIAGGVMPNSGFRNSGFRNMPVAETLRSLSPLVPTGCLLVLGEKRL